jgi:hypothetical protein
MHHDNDHIPKMLRSFGLVTLVAFLRLFYSEVLRIARGKNIKIAHTNEG